MSRIEEIESRCDEIKNEIETRSGEELKALSEELDALIEERKNIMAEAENRKAMLEKAQTVGATVEKVKETTQMDEKRFAVDTMEYRDAFMKKLQGKELNAEERGALTSASSVIPTVTLDRIYGRLAENPLIAELDMLNIAGYVEVPVATTVNDAAWVAMGTAATDAEDVVGKVSLAVYKLIKTVEITADIKSMAIPAFENWLIGALVKKLNAAICNAVLNGSGSSQPTGVISGATAIGTTVTYDNLVGLLTGIGAYMDGGVFVMSSTYFGEVLKLKDSDNRPLVSLGTYGIENKPAYFLFGHKIIIEDAASNVIVFGNFRDGYVFNLGTGITVDADDSVAFRSGSRVYRAMALCDGKPAVASAFAKITVAQG